MIFFIHEKDIYFAFRILIEAKAECKNFKKTVNKSEFQEILALVCADKKWTPDKFAANKNLSIRKKML